MLKALVIDWAREKGILDKAKAMNQGLKTLEEVNELLVAIQNNDRAEVKDALGDIMVTIIIGAELQGMDIVDCLGSAYDIISKRSGKMINGTFIKDEKA